jgi:hypothetical protein
MKSIQVYKDSYGDYPETQYAKGKFKLKISTRLISSCEKNASDCINQNETSHSIHFTWPKYAQ